MLGKPAPQAEDPRVAANRAEFAKAQDAAARLFFVETSREVAALAPAPSPEAKRKGWPKGVKRGPRQK